MENFYLLITNDGKLEEAEQWYHPNPDSPIPDGWFIIQRADDEEHIKEGYGHVSCTLNVFNGEGLVMTITRKWDGCTHVWMSNEFSEYQHVCNVVEFARAQGQILLAASHVGDLSMFEHQEDDPEGTWLPECGDGWLDVSALNLRPLPYGLVPSFDHFMRLKEHGIDSALAGSLSGGSDNA